MNVLLGAQREECFAAGLGREDGVDYCYVVESAAWVTLRELSSLVLSEGNVRCAEPWPKISLVD